VGRFNWQDNSVRILSVLLAFILWVYVNSEQNPLREKTLTVPLEVSGPPQGYVFFGNLPQTVKVKVEGDKSLLARISPSDLKAEVIIPGDKTGEVTLPVQVAVAPGTRLSQVLPAEVLVNVDRLAEKEVPVAVSLRGSPAQGYTALAPVCRPAYVTVRGPSSVLKEIGQVAAAVDMEGSAGNVEQDVEVSAGRRELSADPAAVRVTVPVVGAAGALTAKTVPVVPKTAGTPAAGWEVKRCTADPPAVQVFGPAGVLAGINSVETEAVGVQGAGGTVEKEAGLVLPAGAAAVQPGRVKVKAEIERSKGSEQGTGEKSGEGKTGQ